MMNELLKDALQVLLPLLLVQQVLLMLAAYLL